MPHELPVQIQRHAHDARPIAAASSTVPGQPPHRRRPISNYLVDRWDLRMAGRVSPVRSKDVPFTASPHLHPLRQ